MRPRSLVREFVALLFGLVTCVACSHPAERALQGVWLGTAVENFEEQELPAATGWAKGTQFEFQGTRLTVTVPAEGSRHGTYRLNAIQDRHVTLSVLDTEGELSEMELIVDDAENLRWVLEEGRTLLLKRQ